MAVRFFEVCPYMHDHPNGEGIGDCEAAYATELARLVGHPVKLDGPAPCCGHDPVIEHRLEGKRYWCLKCSEVCPELARCSRCGGTADLVGLTDLDNVRRLVCREPCLRLGTNMKGVA